MRDDSYLDSSTESEVAAAPWRGRAATAFGAAASIAIIVAVVVWSYRLGVRDAADIPVIRANFEVTKIRPEEPGGLEVAHQDRAVYGAVSGVVGAEGEAGLAPAPDGLRPEDAAPIAAAPPPAPRPAEDGAAQELAAVDAAGEATSAQTPSSAEAAAPAPDAASEDAIAAAVAQEVAAALEATPEEATKAPAAAPPPARRPARRVAAAATTEAAEPRQAASQSSIQIQLGAFVSETIAAEQWTAIKGRNADILAGRGRVITSVDSGGRRLFRLRAGPFASIEEASALCRGLKARNEICIVARARQ